MAKKSVHDVWFNDQAMAHKAGLLTDEEFQRILILHGGAEGQPEVWKGVPRGLVGMINVRFPGFKEGLVTDEEFQKILGEFPELLDYYDARR